MNPPTNNKNFTGGIHYFLRGLFMLTKPGIRRYVIIPLLINLIAFSLLIAFGIHGFNLAVQWIDQWIPSWLHWLNFLLWVLFALVTIIFITYTFTLIANLLATPFNGLLSAKIQKQITGKSPDELSWLNLIKETPRMIKRQLQFIFYALGFLLVAVLLMFIPLVQFGASLVWFGFSCWIQTTQYVDYPMDNNNISFREMRRLMANERGLYFGFGLAVNIATMIPILNFVVMPAAVIGATLMEVENTHHLDGTLT